MEEEEAAGVRKRKRGGEAGLVEGGGCFYWKEAEEDEGEEYEGIAEESVEEVMRWLELEISSSPGKGGGGGDDGFVTINGNEESCGPSFSAAASTVMASVDTRAGAPPPPTAIPWPWPEPEDPARDDDHHGTKAAADGEDVDMAELVDEEWLVELLTGGGPAALEAFTLAE